MSDVAVSPRVTWTRAFPAIGARVRLPWAVVALVAAMLPLLLVLPHGDSAWIGNQGDAKLFAWYLDDVATGLRQGHLQLTTNLIDHPGGVNLLWNTSVLLLAVAAAPITLTLGPVLAYNLLVTAGVGLSTLVAYAALRRFTHTSGAAALGAFVYGVSPFVAGQAVGHLHLSFAVYPPLALLLIDGVVRGGRHPWRSGALLGATTAAQLLIGEELVLLTVLGTGIGLAVAACQHREAVRACLPRLARMLCGAALVGGTIAAPVLAFQFLGPQHAQASMNSYLLGNDAAGAFIPTPTRLLAPGWTSPAVGAISITAEDADAYIGLPILLLIGLRLRPLLADVRTRFALVTGAIALVLSFGDTLRAAGRTAGVPLPWAILEHLPLVGDAAPARMAVIADLMLGLVLAVSLEQLAAQRRDGRRRAARLVALAVCALSILPAVPAASTADTTPAFFTGAASRIAEGSVVLVTPWPDSNGSEAMLWQARAGLRWSMPGGEAFASSATLDGPPSPLHATVVDIDRRAEPAPPLTSALRAQLLADLRSMGVDEIVVGPSARASAVEDLFTRLLGRPAEHLDGVAVWWSV